MSKHVFLLATAIINFWGLYATVAISCNEDVVESGENEEHENYIFPT